MRPVLITRRDSPAWTILALVSLVVVVRRCSTSSDGGGGGEKSTGHAEMDTGDCAPVGKDQSRLVCVCSEHKCNGLAFEWPTAAGQVRLVESTRGGLRFNVSQLPDATPGFNGSSRDLDLSASLVSADISKQRQTVLGWGGAFTDAAAINIQSLTEPVRERLLESLFGPEGLQYNIGRVPIGGSDFSTRAYSYNDNDGQTDLNQTNWALADEDVQYKIPVIKRAIELAKQSNATQLKLFGSPWSPPKWMKTNHDFRRGHLLDRDEIYESYASYLIKFYESYREHGIEFWGGTIQNEPIASYLPFYFFNSLQMSARETIRFVADHLGPALERKGYTKENFKLMVGDDSLGFVNYQVPSVMADERVRKYVSGLAFHWYLSGLLAPYGELTKLLDKIQDSIEFVMMSEACQGAFMSFKHVILGDWSRGESYASDIIEDFRRRTGAWVDWNLALDLEGGPNWSGNFVDSPIIVDKAKNQFMRQPMYYAIAHFSRFMRPGSVVIDSSSEKLRGISMLAAHKKDTNHVIITMLNKSNSLKRFSVSVNDQAGVLYGVDLVELQPKSIGTIVVKL